MSYDFSFDKKSVFLILGGCATIGVLLFFAGFVVGWDRGTYAAHLEMENKDGSRTVQKAPVSAIPVSKMGSPPAPETTTKSAPAAPGRKPAADPEAKPDKPSPIPAAEAKPDKPSTAAAPKPAGQTTAQASPEKPSSPAADPADPASDQSAFSLQLGAFQDEHNAVRFKNDLKSRGYPAFVFNTLDAGGRVWHTVRIGHFPDIKKASDAAAVLAGKEKIPVFVRPGNEL